MDSGDKETLEFEAHTLGSSSLALGNRVLSNLARKKSNTYALMDNRTMHLN
ncbi:hypothetical protein QW180_19095 [Vibrio sinaloensis]|nr:hypothetical protein [Vibrio sinaloensis]